MEPAPPSARTQRDALAQTIPGVGLTAADAAGHAARAAAASARAEGAAAPAAPAAPRLEQRLRAVGCPALPAATGPRLELGRALGAGATATVFAARDADLARDVAVKVLTPDACARPADVAAFVAEARTTAALSHPNVVPVHEIDVGPDGRPYFTMARIDGRTLADVLDASTPDRRDPRLADVNAVVGAIIAVGHAVAYAHHRGLIHQDIKPANILLGDFGQVALLDWGSAVAWPSPDAAARLYGTPLYMSPEQARREASTPASDVYCLGATLFHALTLRLPTWSEDAQEFWRRKALGALDEPTTQERRAVPPELLAIALKALRARPDDRYTSVEALVADLSRYQAGQAVSAWRAPLWRVLARWYAHNRATALTALAALIALALVAGAWWDEHAKALSRWREVYRSDFAAGGSEALDRDWTARTAMWGGPFIDEPLRTSQRWRVDGGRVIAHLEDGYGDLVFRRPPPGDLRVSWRYTPLAIGENMNCFLAGDDRRSGYTFHVGGWNDPTYCVLTRRNDDLAPLATCRVPGLIAVGRAAEFMMERSGRRLRLTIDGRTVIDAIDDDDLAAPTGQAFGFDCCFGNTQAIEDVRVWHRPPAQLRSAVEAAVDLYRLGHYADATRAFAELVDAYPGTELEAPSRYGRGMALIGAGDRAAGVAALRDFVARFPSDERAPLALERLLRIDLEAGDTAHVAADDGALLAFPGHRVLRSARTALCADARRRIERAHTVDFHGELIPHTSAVDAALGEVAALRAWCERHGTPFAGNQLSAFAADVAHRVGRDELVPELVPDDDERRLSAAAAACRYDLMSPAWRTTAFRIALEGGRPADAFAAAQDGWRKGTAAADLCEPQRVLDDPLCTTSERIIALLEVGEPGEVLRRYPERRAWCAQAYNDLGRYAEALAACDDATDALPDQRVRALCGLGRTADAWRAVTDPAYGGHRQLDAWTVALECVARADAAAAPIMRELTALPDDAGDDRLAFARYLLPPLIAALAGDRGALAAWHAGPAARRDLFHQALWHDAAYISGAIDDAAYLAQPFRRHLASRSAFAAAIRAELAGDAATAQRRYHEALTTRPQAGLEPLRRRFATWRTEALAARRP